MRCCNMRKMKKNTTKIDIQAAAKIFDTYKGKQVIGSSLQIHNGVKIEKLTLEDGSEVVYKNGRLQR